MLAENQWNIVRTARILGIDRSTLYHKIKRYQLRKDA
jgi:transcriptional regulator of acetoin/glycerol metabolism